MALTCEPWADEEDLCGPCMSPEYEGGLADQAALMLEAATDLLYQWSGRRYPGLCERTVRPCVAERTSAGLSRPDGWGRSWGVCRCLGSCSCPGRGEVELGAYPVREIVRVLVDGEELDPSLYRLDDQRTLVRLRDPDGSRPGWPARQDLSRDDTDEGTWSVTFVWGTEPPPAGVHAAAVLACELAMACSQDEAVQGACRLPKNATSVTREGITMVLSPSDFLDRNGNTGLYEIDLFLQAANPTRERRRPSVWWPGAPSQRQAGPVDAGS